LNTLALTRTGTLWPARDGHWTKPVMVRIGAIAHTLARSSKLAKTPLEVGKLLPTGFSWQTVSNLIPL
jgi:hypothetical protein